MQQEYNNSYWDKKGDRQDLLDIFYKIMPATDGFNEEKFKGNASALNEILEYNRLMYQYYNNGLANDLRLPDYDTYVNNHEELVNEEEDLYEFNMDWDEYVSDYIEIDSALNEDSRASDILVEMSSIIENLYIENTNPNIFTYELEKLINEEFTELLTQYEENLITALETQNLGVVSDKDVVDHLIESLNELDLDDELHNEIRKELFLVGDLDDITNFNNLSTDTRTFISDEESRMSIMICENNETKIQKLEYMGIVFNDDISLREALKIQSYNFFDNVIKDVNELLYDPNLVNEIKNYTDSGDRQTQYFKDDLEDLQYFDIDTVKFNDLINNRLNALNYELNIDEDILRKIKEHNHINNDLDYKIQGSGGRAILNIATKTNNDDIDLWDIMNLDQTNFNIAKEIIYNNDLNVIEALKQTPDGENILTYLEMNKYLMENKNKILDPQTSDFSWELSKEYLPKYYHALDQVDLVVSGDNEVLITFDGEVVDDIDLDKFKTEINKNEFVKQTNSLEAVILQDNPNLKYKKELMDLFNMEKGNIIDVSTHNVSDMASLAIIMFEKELYPANHNLAEKVINSIDLKNYDYDLFDEQYIEEVIDYVKEFPNDIIKINELEKINNAFNTYNDFENQNELMYRRDYYENQKNELNTKLEAKLESEDTISVDDRRVLMMNIIYNESKHKDDEEMDLLDIQKIGLTYGSVVKAFDDYEQFTMNEGNSFEDSKVTKENLESYKNSYLTKFVDQKIELNKQKSFAMKSEIKH